MRLPVALFLAGAGAAMACPSCVAQPQSVDTRWLIAAMMAAPVAVLMVVGVVVRAYLPR